MEIPSCISVFKYHHISRLLLVAARGGDSGEEQGLVPSCPTWWSRMLLPCSLCILPHSVLGCGPHIFISCSLFFLSDPGFPAWRGVVVRSSPL